MTPEPAALKGVASVRSPMLYSVARGTVPRDELASWEAWRALVNADILSIAHFHERSSPINRPRVQACLAHDQDAIYAIFQIRGERHVRARHRVHQALVCQDSCVELFLQPGAGIGGYLNIEVNCARACFSHWIADPSPPLREGKLFSQSTPLDLDRLERIQIVSSIDPDELTVAADRQPRDWTLGLRLPFDVLRCYARIPPSLSGMRMAANFYKCADSSPEPHWAAWSDIGPRLSFHQPGRFGLLEFK